MKTVFHSMLPDDLSWCTPTHVTYICCFASPAKKSVFAMMAESLPHGYWVQHSHCYLHIHTASERPIYAANKLLHADCLTSISVPSSLFRRHCRQANCRCATNRVIPTQLIAEDGLCIVHFLEVRTREKTATYLRISRLCSLNIFLFCCSGCV